MQPRLMRHPGGITAVDTEYVRPGLAASHVIVHRGRAAFVDTGTSRSVPLLLAALDILGIPRDAVDYVFITHVHLDHAGGAGRLMQELPVAQAVLHPRGAPHMVDPSRLIAGSIAVYGEERYRQLYGELVPIPAERVRVVQDGERLSLGGRELEFLHTPGHALHHYVIADAAYSCMFTGDTFGLSYREFDTKNGAFVIPTTTPTQFDPDQLLASVRRLLAHGPQAMYLTHYSRVTDVPRLADLLQAQIHELVSIARRHADAPDRESAIRADMLSLWLRLLREHGCTMSDEAVEDFLAMDLDLNTQGIIAWLDRGKK